MLYCKWVTKRVIRPAQPQEVVVGTKKRNTHLSFEVYEKGKVGTGTVPRRFPSVTCRLSRLVDKGVCLGINPAWLDVGHRELDPEVNWRRERDLRRWAKQCWTIYYCICPLVLLTGANTHFFRFLDASLPISCGHSNGRPTQNKRRPRQFIPDWSAK